jgi:hypothetical protein
MAGEVWGYTSEDDFDRASKAIRFAESLMRGRHDPRAPHRPKVEPNEVTVIVKSLVTVDDYEYGKGKFTYWDESEVEWVETDFECYAYGLNDETLEVGKRYHGRTVSSLEDLSVVEVTVGGGGTGNKIAARVTAYSAPWYSWEEIALQSDGGSGANWITKPGGQVGTGSGYRAPILEPATPSGEPAINPTPPFEVGEFVKVWPSKVFPGKFEMTPWATKRAVAYIDNVVTQADFNTETCVFTKTEKKIRIVGIGIQVDEITP